MWECVVVSPTQRSLSYLRREGYVVATVERWNAFAGIRQDLFGFIDLLAIRDGETVGVQVTTGGNLAARREKAMGHENFQKWLRAGNRFILHGWRKVGKRGERKVWEVRVEEINLAEAIS